MWIGQICVVIYSNDFYHIIPLHMSVPHIITHPESWKKDIPSTQLGQWSSYYHSHSWGNGHPTIIPTVGAMVILIYKFHSHSWGNGHLTIEFHPHSWGNGHPSSIQVQSTQLGQWLSYFTSSIHTVGAMVNLCTIQVLMKQLG